MCLICSRKPTEEEKNVIGYCYQRKQNNAYYGIFKYANKYYTGYKHEAKLDHTSFLGDEEEKGFYGFFSKDDALKLYYWFYSEVRLNSGKVCLVKCKFENIIAVGSPNCFDITSEANILCFRSQYRTILEEIPLE